MENRLKIMQGQLDILSELLENMKEFNKFIFKENECRKSECDLLISSNKETHRRLLELEQYILR